MDWRPIIYGATADAYPVWCEETAARVAAEHDRLIAELRGAATGMVEWTKQWGGGPCANADECDDPTFCALLAKVDTAGRGICGLELKK